MILGTIKVDAQVEEEVPDAPIDPMGKKKELGSENSRRSSRKSLKETKEDIQANRVKKKAQKGNSKLLVTQELTF